MRNPGLVQDVTSEPIVAFLFWFLTEKMFYPLKSNPVSKFSLSMRSQKSLEGSWKTRFGKKKINSGSLVAGMELQGNVPRLPPTLLCGHGSQQAPVEWGRAYPSWTQDNLPHRDPKPFQILSWKCCFLLMSLVGNLSLTIYKKVLTGGRE